MKGIDAEAAEAIERIARERGGTITVNSDEVTGVAKGSGRKGGGTRGGRPRYKAPDETRRMDSDAMIRQYGHPKPERPVVWVERVQDLMNGTEREYAGILDARVAAGEVMEWRYEFASFRLGHALHYNPDFLVVMADGRLEVHEVKSGKVEEDSWVKMKVFVTLFPFLPLYMARRGKKGFEVVRVKHGGPLWSEPRADGTSVEETD